MIRFPEIWQCYQQGELKELVPQQKNINSNTGFKDLDESTKTINEIVSFDDKPYLQQLQKKTSPKPAITTLETMLSDIEQVEEHIAQQKANVFLHGHAIRIIRLGHQYDTRIQEQATQLVEAFSKAYSLVDEAITPLYAQEVRKETNTWHDLLLRTHAIAQRRNIKQAISADEENRMFAYSEKKKIINKIQENIIQLQREYDACLENTKGPSYSKKLLRKIKNFWGGGLLTQAKKAQFIEGKDALETLYETLLDFKKNPKPHYLQKQLQLQLQEKQSKNTNQKAVMPDNQQPTYKEQQPNQPENRTQAIHPEQHEQTYSLPMHLRSIGYPENFQLYPLRRALLDTTPWEKRFEICDKQISNLAKEKNHLSLPSTDKQYLKSVAEGIYLAMQKPEKDFPIKTAKKTYELLQTISSY